MTDNKTVTVPCPHCGNPNMVRVRTDSGGQVESCSKCHKNYRINFSRGQVTGTSDR